MAGYPVKEYKKNRGPFISLGRVINISDGPAPGSTLYVKQAGNIIIPATNATNADTATNADNVKTNDWTASSSNKYRVALGPTATVTGTYKTLGLNDNFTYTPDKNPWLLQCLPSSGKLRSGGKGYSCR